MASGGHMWDANAWEDQGKTGDDEKTENDSGDE